MFPDRQRHGSAKRAAVVMQTHAFDFELLAVKPKARRGIEMKFTNPERDIFFINNFSIRLNARHLAIESPVLNIPKLRIRD